MIGLKILYLQDDLFSPIKILNISLIVNTLKFWGLEFCNYPMLNLLTTNLENNFFSIYRQKCTLNSYKRTNNLF